MRIYVRLCKTTQITSAGPHLRAQECIERRDRLTRRKRWELSDEEISYGDRQLDRDVVNPDQIRTVVQTFRQVL